jgi:hypothetical protein
MDNMTLSVIQADLRPMKEISGKLLWHRFLDKKYWDGNFCSDYCAGCGSCDHFPPQYAVAGYKHIEKIIRSVCDNCKKNYHGKFSTIDKQCDTTTYKKYAKPKGCTVAPDQAEGCTVAPDQAGAPDDTTQPVVDNVPHYNDANTKKCCECGKRKRKEIPNILYEYVINIICEACATIHGIRTDDRLGYKRCGDYQCEYVSYYCDCCKEEFKIIAEKDNTVDGEEIISNCKKWRNFEDIPIDIKQFVMKCENIKRIKLHPYIAF